MSDMRLVDRLAKITLFFIFCIFNIYHIYHNVNSFMFSMFFLNKKKFVRPQEMSPQSDKLSVSSEATKDPENLYVG